MLCLRRTAVSNLRYTASNLSNDLCYLKFWYFKCRILEHSEEMDRIVESDIQADSQEISPYNAPEVFVERQTRSSVHSMWAKLTKSDSWAHNLTQNPHQCTFINGGVLDGNYLIIPRDGRNAVNSKSYLH